MLIKEKKYIPAALLLIAILLAASHFTAREALALQETTVESGHGHLSALLVFNTDRGDAFHIGGHYGVWGNLALFGEYGDPHHRLGGRYQFHENFAAVAGHMPGESIFTGISADYSPISSLKIAGELSLAVSKLTEELALYYDLGLIYDLPENLDLRAAITDLTSDDESIRFKIGFGYNI